MELRGWRCAQHVLLVFCCVLAILLCRLASLLLLTVIVGCDLLLLLGCLQGMEECRAAYQAAADWFGFWCGRGDVAEGEAALIADKVGGWPQRGSVTAAETFHSNSALHLAAS